MQSDMIKVIHGYRAAERPSKSSKIPKVSPYTFFRRFDITTEILETTKILQALEAAGIMIPAQRGLLQASKQKSYI